MGKTMNTIIVPVDGASNIKLEVLDFDTLTTVFSRTTETPVTEAGGLKYNCTAGECSWFDSVIKALPEKMKSAKVIPPVARGASGGLVGFDGTLTEVPGEGLTLAYTQKFSAEVDETFCELAGSEQDFYLETGSIRDFPGSLTLLKRFLYEEIQRPEVLGRAAGFGTYGILLSGHFLGDDYLKAVRVAGNELSYWMCHTGARNINKPPGTPSSVCNRIKNFGKLVPAKPFKVYSAIGDMPRGQAEYLGLSQSPKVTPGGHDTCLSHIPVMSTFYQAFEDKADTPVVHLDAGSWTMVAQIGGEVELPSDGYRRNILVQGTVDGDPVVTSLYGGGNDFKYLKELVEKRGRAFGGECDEDLLERVLDDKDCFVLPNINPMNYQTGPFPRVKGRIVNEPAFFDNGEKALILANLSTAIVATCQIDLIAERKDLPVVITAGGSKDPYFGRLIATLSGRDVYAMLDCNLSPISETTTLGAAIAGKAAVSGVHPYEVDMSALSVSYRKQEPFNPALEKKLSVYRERFLRELKKHE
jgi:carbohydrate kinase of FGGY family protein